MPRALRRRARAALLFAAAAVAAQAALVALSPASGATTAPNCGGELVKKPTGAAWTCTFDEEFNGTALDRTKWVPQLTATSGYTTGALGSKVCYLDSPNVIHESGGYLSLTVRRETKQFKCGNFYTPFDGGTVSTYGKFSQAYGRFEVRAKFPASLIRGLHAALWMWPVNPTKYGAEPKSGEIDIAEQYSNMPNVAAPYIHYVSKVKDPNVTNWNCAITPGAFSTYVLVWTTTTLTISINGKTCVQDTWAPHTPLVAPQPFDQPFFMVLTQGLGGIGSDSYVSTTPLPATTQVDYVRIWK